MTTFRAGRIRSPALHNSLSCLRMRARKRDHDHDERQFIRSTIHCSVLSGTRRSAGQSRPKERRERTIEEIKTEAVHRAEVGQYPLIGLDPADVKEAFKTIHTNDKDEWAAGFMSVAIAISTKRSRWRKPIPRRRTPTTFAPGGSILLDAGPSRRLRGSSARTKRRLKHFLLTRKFFDPPLEVVRIPFEGKEIIGYLRLPKNAKGPVPLVIAVNGLDSRKEDLTESFGAILPFGVGYLAVDGPGTGQAPIKVSETSERMLSKVIDYAQSRPEIDKNRIALHGVSWGAYWATKMAIVERGRLRGASAQSPPVDRFFQKDFLMNSSAGQSRISFRSGARADEYSRRRALARRDGRVSAEDVAGSSRTAGQADGADAHPRGRSRHAGSHRR